MNLTFQMFDIRNDRFERVNLNLFQINIPTKVRRIYYYNPQTPPEIFARNLTRINNIRFTHSADLVWVELPLLQVQILPRHTDKYKKTEEIIENDEKLFIRTLYAFIEKLFKDNGFMLSKEKLYISKRTKTEFENNRNVSYYESYLIKIYKIEGKFYLSINPRITFLSTKPALESSIKSSFVLNTVSGRSFPFIAASDGKLIIAIDEKLQKEVAHPENYFFNFTTEELGNFGVLKEMHEIYKSKIPSMYKKLTSDLSFLSVLANLTQFFEVEPERLEKIVVSYRFSKDTSHDVRDIFQLKPLRNPGTLKIAYLFPENYKKEDPDKLVKETFTRYEAALSWLGFKKIEHLINPRTGKKVFYYREKTFELEDRETLSKSGRTHAIVALEEEQEGLEKLLNEMPKNLIVLPVLPSNIKKNEPYIPKSFAYKTLNFVENAQAYKLLGLSEGALYIGFDLSHDLQKRKSHYALSAVDNNAKVLYINQKRDIQLNEKLELEILEKDIVKSFDRYEHTTGRIPKILFLIRDGIFLENLDLLRNHLDLLNVDYVIVEINKKSNLNSWQNLKGTLVELETNRYVYFAETFNLQRAVEINIVSNRSKLPDKQIAREIYLTTRLFHATPYSTLKLPYPLYITDKVALLGEEWSVYIPYFKSSIRENFDRIEYETRRGYRFENNTDFDL